MSSLLVIVLSGAWGAAKSIGEFSVGGAPNGPGFGPTGLGSAGAGSGSPGGPGGDDPGNSGDGGGGSGDGGEGSGGESGNSGDSDGGDGNSGDGDSGDEPGDWELGGGDEPYDHEAGLPSPDDPALDTLDRTLWDTLKNLLDVGPAISVLELGPGTYRAIGESKRYERKLRKIADADHKGDAHLRGGKK